MDSVDTTELYTLARDSSWPLFICVHSTLALGAAGHGDWCGKWLQYFMLLTDYAGMKLWKKLTTKVHPKVQATLAEISFETAVTSELHNGWAPGISILIILLSSSCRYCIVYDWIVNVMILIVSCAVYSIWGCITVLYCSAWVYPYTYCAVNVCLGLAQHVATFKFPTGARSIHVCGLGSCYLYLNHPGQWVIHTASCMLQHACTCTSQCIVCTLHPVVNILNELEIGCFMWKWIVNNANWWHTVLYNSTSTIQYCAWCLWSTLEWIQ